MCVCVCVVSGCREQRNQSHRDTVGVEYESLLHVVLDGCVCVLRQILFCAQLVLCPAHRDKRSAAAQIAVPVSSPSSSVTAQVQGTRRAYSYLRYLLSLHLHIRSCRASLPRHRRDNLCCLASVVAIRFSPGSCLRFCLCGRWRTTSQDHATPNLLFFIVIFHIVSPVFLLRDIGTHSLFHPAHFA